MRIAVIGSNSFSGAHFVRGALNGGNTVLGISRSPEPHKAFLPHMWEGNSRTNYQFLQADVNSELPQIMSAINNLQPQVVVNFAAQSMVGQSWDFPEHWYRTNTVSLAELVKKLESLQSMERYVHVTTPEVYGSTNDWVTEHESFAPSTPYAVSRAAGDWHLLALHRASGFPVVLTRAANVYGPGQQLYRIIPRAIMSARLEREIPLHGGGTSRRSFIHIEDVVNATLEISRRGSIGETYHISTNELISIRDLVVKVFELARADSSALISPTADRLGKDSGYFLDSSKLRLQFDWVPRVSLDQGIQDTIAWVDNYIEDLSPMPTDYVHKP